MDTVPDLIWTIGVLLSGIIVASAPLFVLRRRDSWRPLTVPVTLLVGLSVFVAAPLFLGDLGRWLGAAVLVPALVICVPLLRAQLAAPTVHVPIDPGESEDSVEVALRSADRLDILERRRRFVLKRGWPILAVGIGLSIWTGVWTPLLIVSGVLAFTGAMLWPGFFPKPGTLGAAKGTDHAERLLSEDGSGAVCSDGCAEAPSGRDSEPR